MALYFEKSAESLKVSRSVAAIVSVSSTSKVSSKTGHLQETGK